MKNNQNIKFIILGVVSLLCFSSTRVHASASITLDADTTNFFATSTGVYLNDGDLVEMGQFTIGNSAIQALVSGGQVSQANYNTLLSDFEPLNVTASNPIGIAGESAGDENSGEIQAVFYGSNTTFASGPIYLMVINTSATNTASQVGVFTGSTWNYPGNMGNGFVTITADQASQTPLIGSYTTASGSGNGWNENDGAGLSTIGQLRLDSIVTVPEPSTIALVGMGLLGAFTIRRRSRKA